MKSYIEGSGGAYTEIRRLIQLRYAVHEMEDLSLPRSTNPLSGLLTSRFQGRGIDFSEVRVYQPGDDVRTIDWRVTARTRTPHTKLFQEEKERPVLVLVDQSHSMFFGSKLAFKSVLAAEAAALIAWTTLDRGDRVGGIVFSDSQHREVRPRRSKHSVLRLLHEIDDFNHRLNREHDQQSISYLADAMSRVRRVAKHGSAVFVVSDFRNFDHQARVHLRQLSQHNDIVGVMISDSLEQQLPAPDVYTITNGATKTKINTAKGEYREQYAGAYETFVNGISNEFARIKCPLLQLHTHNPLVQSLPAEFAKLAARS